MSMRALPPLWFVMMAVGSVLAAEVVAIVLLNAGQFTYTLDDPYIHLALAEELAHGHYGINMGEAASPSSSILWPFILAPFARTAVGSLTPLILNVLFALGTSVVMFRLLHVSVEAREMPLCEAPACTQQSVPSWTLATATLGLVLITNVPGLVFTGLEHSLQILLAATLALGLCRTARGYAIPYFVWPTVMAGPWVRYESLGLSLAALTFLYVAGARRISVLVGLLMLVPMAGFSWFLGARGLSPLPASVLAKTSLVTESGGLLGFLQSATGNAWKAVTHENRGLALCMAGLLLAAFGVCLSDKLERKLARSAVLAVIVHLCCGRYGWYHRYEVYAWTFVVLILVSHSARPFLRNLPRTRPLIPVLVAGASLLSAEYAGALFTTPWAAHNVYLQQFQMARIVRNYGKPVAVNDLGLVAYQNPAYVLDFGGLASPAALHAYNTESDGAWMERMAQEHHVELVLIYDSWFRDMVPNTWTKLAELRMMGPCITPASDTVSIYARSTFAASRALDVLVALAPTLPQDAVLRVFEADGRPRVAGGQISDACAR